MEGLSEFHLDAVEQRHGLGDAVERQNSRAVIQIHPDPVGSNPRHGMWDTVVIECVRASLTLQSP